MEKDLTRRDFGKILTLGGLVQTGNMLFGNKAEAHPHPPCKPLIFYTGLGCTRTGIAKWNDWNHDCFPQSHELVWANNASFCPDENLIIAFKSTHPGKVVQFRMYGPNNEEIHCSSPQRMTHTYKWYIYKAGRGMMELARKNGFGNYTVEMIVNDCLQRTHFNLNMH